MKLNVFVECNRKECHEQWKGAYSEKPDMVLKVDPHQRAYVEGTYICPLCGNNIRIDIQPDNL